MRIKLENVGQLLLEVRNDPLVELTTEDVNSALQDLLGDGCFQQSQPSVTPPLGFIELGSQITPMSQFQGFKTPLLPSLQNTPLLSAIMKTPLFSTRFTPNDLRNISSGMTPLLNSLNSLGTPLLNGLMGTPGSCFVPSTPMILDPLRVFDLNNRNAKFHSSTPDILQLIDNEKKTVEDVQRHMMPYTDIPLNDNNFIDYLLDVTNEFTVLQSPHKRKQQAAEDQLRCRRKCARAKPMTKEEQESIYRLRKQKMKEERKERKEKFKKRKIGSRMSKRSTTKVKYF